MTKLWLDMTALFFLAHLFFYSESVQSAVTVIIPKPSDSGHPEDLYQPTLLYIRGSRNIPLLNIDGAPIGLSLRAGTKVWTHLINEQGAFYQGGLGQKPHGSKFVHVQSISPASPTSLTPSTSPILSISPTYANPIQGLVHATHLTANPPISIFKDRSFQETPTNRIPSWALPKLAKMDIPKTIEVFHNSLCLEKDSGPSDQRENLIKQWEKFIDNVAPINRPTAKLAMGVDMVARTVLYESHPFGSLSFRHPHQSTCEWDIITLSIRNRAWNCNKPYFHCRFQGDYVGVATAPSQYHIWRPRHMNKTHITSCFLYNNKNKKLRIKSLSHYSRHSHSHSKKELTVFEERANLKTLTREGKKKVTKKRVSNHEKRKKIFQRLIQRIPMIFGLYEREEDKDQGTYLNKLFRVTRVGEKEITAMDQDEQVQRLTQYQHYYHPLSLGACWVDKYPYTQYISSSYISMNTQDPKYEVPGDFGLLIRARILRERQYSDGSWSFSIKNINADNTVSYVPANDYFYGHPHIYEKYFIHLNNSYTCLPQGQLPICYKKQKANGEDIAMSSRGKRVPTQWFNQSMKNKVRDFLTDQRGLDIPKGWDETATSDGEAIGLKCLSENLRADKRLPEFDGLCDRNLMPVTGAK